MELKDFTLYCRNVIFISHNKCGGWWLVNLLHMCQVYNYNVWYQEKEKKKKKYEDMSTAVTEILVIFIVITPEVGTALLIFKIFKWLKLKIKNKNKNKLGKPECAFTLGLHTEVGTALLIFKIFKCQKLKIINKIRQARVCFHTLSSFMRKL